ncbi:hypothetical protein A2533_04130 [Candidatus Falkowbacteria bacterium RIFOXYD2_FULL_35_9]|uniref:DUF559 domain-containing protein n=1 Tax=Candidatus Falkowbacteria bacterium RIFOXYC2_FULL_36_12 TaxID=1798002 RepID=A0A1F5SY47_9BACT|nr:MAG: hypothetical protein A2478_04125 [Candidatus Falkowbacteria bacterium RIFOXYC2_FULL_36_12]OGF46714.1 MAG: hypothetical protein A2533_04130 [Candidatus Falkowbacteria bacterium RIFOXYD2_FULL_35_9]
MGQIHNKRKLLPLRRKLRNSMTSAEVMLWSRIKGKQLCGIKFRRQHSIGRYIVDFYCPESRLVIEVDGPSHYSDKAVYYDGIRTDYLESLQINVFRVRNDQVYNELEQVLQAIADICKKN